ncbi:MAG: methyltransferase [Bryobacteraceae bacterium]|nr:methyltransferase [Bryobacteraceae bacterium]MDW8379843.1 methyltransferase [Bryobacterales bacterium]
MLLSDGPLEAFSSIREFLAQSGYSEEFLLDHFQVPGLHAFLNPVGAVREYLHSRYQGKGLPLLLARLFLGGYALERAALEASLPRPVLQSLEQVGLLERDDRGLWRSPCLLYPIGDLWIAADFAGRMEGAGYKGKDFCMTGVEEICRDFIDSFPRRPCQRFLDMGTGSGLAAIIGSLEAREAYGVDITARAIQYARFNGLLNARSNVHFLQGDMFEPVRGLEFDRIVCNPPFEPPLKQGMIYSVGGADGEALIARLIEQGVKQLTPGGRMYVMVTATDREGEPFEERVIRWLGDQAPECDVAIHPHSEMNPVDYASQQVLGTNLDSWKIVDYQIFYGKLKAYRVLVGQLIIEKRARQRPVVRLRHKDGAATTLREREWLLELQQRFVEPDGQEFLLGARPVFGANWHLRVRHGVVDNHLAALDYTFVSEHPFEAELTVPPWVARVVAECKGTDSLASLYELLHAKMPVPKEEFLRMMSLLISQDVIRIPGYAPPAPVSPSEVRKGY